VIRIQRISAGVTAGLRGGACARVCLTLDGGRLTSAALEAELETLRVGSGRDGAKRCVWVGVVWLVWGAPTRGLREAQALGEAGATRRGVGRTRLREPWARVALTTGEGAVSAAAGSARWRGRELVDAGAEAELEDVSSTALSSYYGSGWVTVMNYFSKHLSRTTTSFTSERKRTREAAVWESSKQ
jgi:hypothetical protein